MWENAFISMITNELKAIDLLPSNHIMLHKNCDEK